MLRLLQKWDDQKNLEEIQAYLLFFADDNWGPPGPVEGPIFLQLIYNCTGKPFVIPLHRL